MHVLYSKQDEDFVFLKQTVLKISSGKISIYCWCKDCEKL